MHSNVNVHTRADLNVNIAEAFTFDNLPLLAAAAVSYVCGFLQYYYPIRLSLRERKAPYPFWMHLFYLAHDSSWSVILHNTAPRYGNHWFFVWTSRALAVWSALEIFCIYSTLFAEGGDISGDQLRRHDRKHAVWHATIYLLSMYGLLHFGISVMGEDCLMQSFALTNVVMVMGTTSTWLRRGSRDGLSVSLGIVNVIGTIFTFAPFSMWVQVGPEVFENPVYYGFGVILTILAVNNLVIVVSYPSKVARKGQSAPIW
jgi:hypothetical protein